MLTLKLNHFTHPMPEMGVSSIECRISHILVMLLAIILLLSIGGIHILRMEGIYKEIKRLELTNREIFYLDTKVEQLRQMIAPVILRLFSVRNASEGIEILYRGEVIWRGDLRDLNITYYVKCYGPVILTQLDGRALAMTMDRELRYTLKEEWSREQAYFIDYVIGEIEPMLEALEEKGKFREELRERIFSSMSDPYLVFFLATPLLSIVTEYLILRRLGLGEDYAELMRSPYVVLPAAAVYLTLAYLTFIFLSGNLLPLHLFILLYALMSIPSLGAVLLYYHRACAE